MYKTKLFFPLIFGLLINACMSPSEPIGIKAQLETTINTGGFCLDIDLKDSLLIAATDENGYQFYKFSVQSNKDINYQYLHGENSFYNDNSPYRVESVLISNYHNFFLILDYPDIFHYRNIFGNIDVNDVPTDIEPEREKVRSMTIDETNPDNIILYTLSKIIFMDSTYISIKYLDISEDTDSTVFIFGAGFDSYSELRLEARDIFFADNLLSISNSQLGVIVLKQNEGGGLSEFTSFDTPGEVNTVYSIGNHIFAGLSDDQGCIITLLDSAGGIINSDRIANGYSVKGIHVNNDILALACGNDGVFLYNWYVTSNGIQNSEMGWLDSEYAFKVNIYNTNTIFVATREGIQIFTIER